MKQLGIISYSGTRTPDASYAHEDEVINIVFLNVFL
jgi:hypothetical protein